MQATSSRTMFRESMDEPRASIRVSGSFALVGGLVLVPVGALAYVLWNSSYAFPGGLPGEALALMVLTFGACLAALVASLGRTGSE